ncbi:MAG: carbohydrate kinase family protein [Anaerolineae bacterium]|nr:carbohydrate kinase family protein [Anaerolineae bacterium]
MKNVILIGDINIDVQMQVAGLPALGGEVLTQGIHLSLGGSASNAAVVLAKLGQHDPTPHLTAHLIGRVGQDEWAKIALDTLRGCGVEVSAVQRDPSTNTSVLFNAITPDGERSMFTYRGANVNTTPADIPADLFARADWLHISGYALLNSPQREAVWQAVNLAQHHRVPISLDPALFPAQHVPAQLLALLPHLALCVLGPDEAEAILSAQPGSLALRDLAAALLERGVKCVALKLGAQGCVIATANDWQTVPAVPAKVVDTTGAGDAFSAGAIYGCLHSWPLPHIGQLAARLGSLATQVVGAGAALGVGRG